MNDIYNDIDTFKIFTMDNSIINNENVIQKFLKEFNEKFKINTPTKESINKKTFNSGVKSILSRLDKHKTKEN